MDTMDFDGMGNTTATAADRNATNAAEIDESLVAFMEATSLEGEEEAAAEAAPFNSHDNDEQAAAAADYYCPDQDPIEAAHRRQRAKDRQELGATWTAAKSGAMAGFRQLKLAMEPAAWAAHLDSVRTWLTLELGLDDAKVIHPLLTRALRRGEDTAEGIERRLLAAEESALLATAVAIGSWEPERCERFLQDRQANPADLAELRANIALFQGDGG